MTKVIKLEDRVHQELYGILSKGETFSEGVERLLDMHRTLCGVEPILRGSVAYHEFKEHRAAEKAAAERR